MFRFLSYTPNENTDDSYGFLGIASIVFDDKIILNYSVQKSKENNGFFIVPFSKKLNDVWHKATELDSNILNKELLEMIRGHVNQHYNGNSTKEAAPDPMGRDKTKEEACPF